MKTATVADLRNSFAVIAAWISDGETVAPARSGGHRTVGILPVATALHLGATTILTFDANQKSLAEAEGFVAPV